MMRLYLLLLSSLCTKASFAQLDTNALQDTTLVVKMPGYSKDPLRANLKQQVIFKDSLWQVSLKDRKGNMVELISYADEELTIRKGTYKFYTKSFLKQEGNYDRGYKNGPWKLFNDNGLPSVFASYKWDKLWGKYQEYDAQGVLKVDGFYINNKKASKWKLFNASGILVKEDVYDENGLLISH